MKSCINLQYSYALCMRPREVLYVFMRTRYSRVYLYIYTFYVLENHTKYDLMIEILPTLDQICIFGAYNHAVKICINTT
jgi:hypothetical protein